MKPTDLLPSQEWAKLERELAECSGLTSVVFDADNSRVTDTTTWANELCPLVKGNPDSASQICAMAQQNMVAAARHTEQPVVDECDAGMVKLVVPIMVGEEVAGSVSACGRLLPDGELEERYVADATGRSAQEIHDLAAGVRGITREQAESFAAWAQERVKKLLRAHGA